MMKEIAPCEHCGHIYGSLTFEEIYLCDNCIEEIIELEDSKIGG
jgi:hypothetical protein